jgi:hypothetical protein
MEDFYTYIYYDPSRNNEPIYVGKGYADRAWDHFTRKHRHPFVQRLQYMRKNNIFPVIGIYAGLEEEFAHLLEMELIAKFGRKDLGKGTLLNLTDGGEGVKGLIQSKETIRKRVESTEYAPRTEEVRLKISRTKKENPIVPWNKGKTGVQVYGPRPQHIRDLVALKNTGSKRTEETKQRMSESQKKRFDNATQRANNGQ